MSATNNDRPDDSRAKADKSATSEVKPDRNQAKDGLSEVMELKKRLEEADKKLSEMEELAAQLEDYKNEAARAKADFYNYRTRVERDRARDRVLAAEGTCDVLLPVLDNLDRTLEAIGDKDSALCKGVAMVQRQFFAALQNLGLKPIVTDGDFDPREHDAVMTIDVDDDSRDGKIVEVLHKGYMLGDKVLRAAQVKVGKKR